METENLADHRSHYKNSKDYRNAQRPGSPKDKAVRLLSLLEVRKGWKKNERAIYAAVIRDQLQAVARPGHQPYYLFNEVQKLWGEPLNPEALDSGVESGPGTRDKATYLEMPEPSPPPPPHRSFAFWSRLTQATT